MSTNQRKKEIEGRRYSAADVLCIIGRWGPDEAMAARCRLQERTLKSPISTFGILLRDLPNALSSDFFQPTWMTSPPYPVPATIESYAKDMADVFARLHEFGEGDFQYVLTGEIEDQS